MDVVHLKKLEKKEDLEDYIKSNEKRLKKKKKIKCRIIYSIYLLLKTSSILVIFLLNKLDVLLIIKKSVYLSLF